MRNSENVFHLAIPCRDLDETASFYTILGCRVARRYPDRITLDFFGDQVVFHLAPDEIDAEPDLYPRHFGITFRQKADFDATLELARSAGLRFFKDPFTRFDGLPETHQSFVLVDPSNNLVEFKTYQDPRMMY
ncbi:MAG: VOC family protein [Gammaproteobacteria bacterium]|nr:VOC family protein [Gammaproteobacteria bacterium]